MIVIIDYGMGNLGSILNMIKKVGSEAIISSKPKDLVNADKYILPGVGAFDVGIKNLVQRGIKEILDEQILVKKKPILGICLGMQLMTKSSEEGILPGLSWIDADTTKFDFTNHILKIPHMGWNYVELKKNSLLFQDTEQDPRFYFVHSYKVKCNNAQDILTTTNYAHEFVSSFQKENIYGTQFHPEKSHKYGIRLIKNFVELG